MLYFGRITAELARYFA